MLTIRRLVMACLALPLALPAPAGAADLSGEVGVVSDYRFRGISLSNGQPALQTSLSYELESGLYASAWASTIKAAGSKLGAEIQLNAGYEFALATNFSIDLSGSYTAYPGDWDESYAELGAIARFELGSASAGLGFGYVPAQHGTRDDAGKHGNSYVFAEATFDIPKTPVSLVSTLGYERGFFDEVDHGGKWDWSAGVEIDLPTARAGIVYVGSNAAGQDDCFIASLVLVI